MKATHNTGLLKNGAWGISSNILQLLFVSGFFAILARKFATETLAQLLIAMTICQLIAAFSSMGLGQWFIRKYLGETNKLELTGRFLKIQLGLGFIFYTLSLVFAFGVYSDDQVRLLSMILGGNIILDNMINAIKSLNIAQGRQDKSAVILVIDGGMKLAIGGMLFIHPFSAIILAGLLITVRLITLSLFIKIGSGGAFNLLAIIRTKISWQDLGQLVFKNWRFMVIGSLSILYWRAGSLIISKTLPLTALATYELSFRIFSVFQVLPVILSATVFPLLVNYVNRRDIKGLKELYGVLSFIYLTGAILAYGFIYTFSNAIIPIAFGNGYPEAAGCLQQMFLAFLVMPTVLLQANVIIALGWENKDLWYNLASLAFQLMACLIGLYVHPSLSIVNLAIFSSLIVFHILQDILLVKKKILPILHCLFFYLIGILTIGGFSLIPNWIGVYEFYTAFTCTVIALLLGFLSLRKKRFFSLLINKEKEAVC